MTTRIKTGYLALVRVRFNECDPLGHVNNAVYLNYLEQAAIDHAAAIRGTAGELAEAVGTVFVARKHEITYHQPALENDFLLVCTWLADMRGARGLRSSTVSRFNGDPAGWVDKAVAYAEMPTIAKHDLIVSAHTEWAFMSVTTGRPVRIPDAVRRLFIEVE